MYGNPQRVSEEHGRWPHFGPRTLHEVGLAVFDRYVVLIIFLSSSSATSRAVIAPLAIFGAFIFTLNNVVNVRLPHMIYVILYLRGEETLNITGCQ